MREFNYGYFPRHELETENSSLKRNYKSAFSTGLVFTSVGKIAEPGAIDRVSN